MSSREALSYILEKVDDLDFIFDEKLRTSFKIIATDLEILELLKSKHVDIDELKEDDNVVTYNMSMMKKDRLSEEEFKLLKEWLEDDK